jgi:hypothetical protein
VWYNKTSQNKRMSNLVKTQDWKLNLHQGIDKRGNQNTQLKLNTTKLPMSELIERLVDQLEA